MNPGENSREGITDVPAFQVKEIDPTGAGDSFCAGFITALLEGKSPYEAGLFANAVGALAVTKKGPMEGAPFRYQVDQFMRDSGLTILRQKAAESFSNEDIKRLTDMAPDTFISFGSVDPHGGSPVSDLEYAVCGLKLREIKLNPSSQIFYPNDKELPSVF